jgi:hypothetical protein
MDTWVMFMDCPAYLNRGGTVRCGLPAEVVYRYGMTSTDGPLECAKIHCPQGHWFTGPVESLTWDKQPKASVRYARRSSPAASRRGTSASARRRCAGPGWPPRS